MRRVNRTYNASRRALRTRVRGASAWQAVKRLQIMGEALASVEGAVSEAASDFRLA